MLTVLRKPVKGKIATPIVLDADYADQPIDGEHITRFSIAMKVTDTGALEGDLKLQVSNNAIVDNVGDTTLFNPIRADAFWEDLDGSGFTYDGSTDEFFWDVEEFDFEAIRLVWTHTAGTGTAVVYYVGKGPGGGT